MRLGETMVSNEKKRVVGKNSSLTRGDNPFQRIRSSQ